jgi:hypothetical protein
LMPLIVARHAGRSRVKVTGISWRVMLSHMLKRGEGMGHLSKANRQEELDRSQWAASNRVLVP